MTRVDRARHAAGPAAAQRGPAGALERVLRGAARRASSSAGSRAAAAAVCLGLLVVAGSAATTAVAPARWEAAPSSGSPVLVTAAEPAPPGAGGAADAPAGVPAQAAAPLPAPADLPAPAASPQVPPTAVRVPSAGISSPLVRLGTTPDGALEVPADAALAGWFAQGVAPGQTGPAVIAGHVDSRSGPGVFARLASVQVGAQVDVERADGSTAAFVVTAVQRVAKDAFPTEDVYGPVAGPELRLITCGGAFDEGTGHYADNVVVYARQVREQPASP
ncbi:class F sortase [Quadrisphaera sp. KR29]|uniref:class F sortase n=1 Tax=Quadrisphaera sp. KR29 TaxID=3461391 RepID=UPI004043CB13